MAKQVTIVGVGALGSHLALFLRNEASLRIIDCDKVEQKNVRSQWHGRPGVGKNKTQSLQQSLQFMFGLKVDKVPHRLTSDNVAQLLGGSDLIIDCLDNAVSRVVVQEYARETGTPCLHGALSADGVFGRVVWNENFVIDTEDVAGAATCEGGEHLPFIGIASTLLASAAQKFLSDEKKVGFELHPGGVVVT